MAASEVPDGTTTSRAARLRWLLRAAALTLWSALLVAFWQGAQRAGVGPLDYLLVTVEDVASRPWAALWVLVLYAARPVLLVPITVANLAAGFVLGLELGLAFALLGTLISATIGYGIGRLLGAGAFAGDVPARWGLLRAVRRRAFESVVAGGLMYLHADAVNLPAGLLRVRFPVFLAGIAVGNALTMASAVLAGASVEGRLRDAAVAVDGRLLATGLGLFAVSLALAAALRRRAAVRAAGEGGGAHGATPAEARGRRVP